MVAIVKSFRTRSTMILKLGIEKNNNNLYSKSHPFLAINISSVELFIATN